ncbi:phosphonate metabolism protein [Haematobacter missouriensis]|uniref:Phosphonate metabolism protein n=2 Tax=Haematobacter missouriensis TaxID=366616 RepID=A0A212AYG7_9RHOB|nr:phosphonate metabolism protein [Haematobacter missouriensis]OWJ86508.1 phosphonate metabolism protein [Haematobacter missouriensis]
MMSDYRKLAIFYLPGRGALADFGTAWSGWDPVEAMALPPLAVPGLPPSLAEPGEALGNYGLHGRITAPFRLIDGVQISTMIAALDALAARLAAVEVSSLGLVRVNGMFALAPAREEIALNLLAARIAREVDHFRAPLLVDDVIRRHAARLSGSQRSLLGQWGYPFASPGEDDGFRLHLTGSLPEDLCDQVQAVLEPLVLPLLPKPFCFDRLSLCGEGEDGRFRLIRQFPLSGSV